MASAPVSCADLAKAYWDAVAAHGEDSDEAGEANLAWQIQCNPNGDETGGIPTKPPHDPG